MQQQALKIIETTRRDWGATMESLTLSKQEIIEATGYKRGADQLAELLRAGIPADRRPDGSVRVWRHHMAGIGAPKQKAPRRKPELASDRKAA